MGFYSVFITDNNGGEWPDWFIEKYKDIIFFDEDHIGVLTAKQWFKIYRYNLVEDIHKAIDWNSRKSSPIILVFLHECGGITRCQISEKSIKYSEPDSWRITDDVEHDECHGCSDI